jgi:3''5''-cyclic nucleotide phosphodiesterase.
MVKAPLRTFLFISMICLFSLGSVLGYSRWSVLRCGRLLRIGITAYHIRYAQTTTLHPLHSVFQGNQILSNVSPDEYSRIIKVLEEAILSTDLAVYFRQRGSFLSLVKGGSLAWHREADRGLLRGMTMTVCDLAAITKPWHVEKRVSNTILQRVVFRCSRVDPAPKWEVLCLFSPI